MRYLAWNSVLLDHFFGNPEVDDVLLYADKETINSIGEDHGLGDYNSFLDSVIIEPEQRFFLYDLIPKAPPRSPRINQKLRGGLHKFPLLLAELEDKLDIELPYFNYVILAILAQSNANTQTERGYYNAYNDLIRERLPDSRRVTKLQEYDTLFSKIATKLPTFKNRRVGQYRYVGLIRYQVVLNKTENDKLERLIYQNNIIANEESQYRDVVNKLYQVVPVNSPLREKIYASAKNRCYADWFLNKVMSFDHKAYENDIDDVGSIEKVEKANFALSIDPAQESGLFLLTDLSISFEPQICEGFDLSHHGERIDHQYAIDPVELTDSKLCFKEYACKGKKFEINSIPIKDVNFFQRSQDNKYLQTLSPLPGYETIIVVKNSEKVIQKWEKWAETIIPDVSNKRRYNERTRSIFGKDWIVYIAQNINEPYYKNNKEDFIYKLQYRDKDIDLDIKALGGVKVPGRVRTYLEIAPPVFRVDFPELNISKLILEVYRNDEKIQEGFNIHTKGDLLSIEFTKPEYLSKSHIKLSFSYQVGELNNEPFSKSFDFNIVESKTLELNDGALLKNDKWGETTDSGKEYFNGISIEPKKHLVPMNQNKQNLDNLFDAPSDFGAYFIFLLTGVFTNAGKDSMSRSALNRVIEQAIEFVRIRGIDLEIDYYTKSNLIRTLVALGYLNWQRNPNINEECFQLIPPAIQKIGRSLDGGMGQAYKLTGARSIGFHHILLEYCKKHGTKIKYNYFDHQGVKPAEYYLLPDLLFMDSTLDPDDLKDYLEQKGFHLILQDDIHPGDSILNFMGTMNDFSKSFLLEENLGQYGEAFFQKAHRDSLPRIRIDAKRAGQFGNYHPKRLEVKNGLCYSGIPVPWMEYYVRGRHSEPVFMMNPPTNNSITGLVYFYKFAPLPGLLYKSLVNINNGIPAERKLFILNNPWGPKASSYAYNVFYEFRLSNIKPRRNRIAKILTGVNDYNQNKQVPFFSNSTEAKMYSHTDARFGSDLSEYISIYTNNNKLIAICSLKYDVFVALDYFDEAPNKPMSTIAFEGVEYKMHRIALSLSMNETISKIIVEGQAFLMANAENNMRVLHLEYTQKTEIEIIEIIEIKE